MEVETGLMKWSGRVPPLDLTNVTVCPIETVKQWHKMQPVSKRKYDDCRIETDGLPLDPRDWTRADVWKWLTNLALKEGLQSSPELAQKFPMNGKALCLMTLDMYLARVPIGGKMLYRDFRVRLARALNMS